MNVKQPSDAASSDAEEVELDLELDEVPDAVQQGRAIVGGGADAAKAYVAPIAVPAARGDSKPPPPAEGKVRIDSRVDPRRMPTVKISAREIAAGAIPGWRPGGPAAVKPAQDTAQATPQPDWMVQPGTARPPVVRPAPAESPPPNVTAISGVLWIFAIVLTACAIVAVGAVLWVELSRKPSLRPASSAEAPVPTTNLSALPEPAPVVPAVSAAPAHSGSKRPVAVPKTRSSGR